MSIQDIIKIARIHFFTAVPTDPGQRYLFRLYAIDELKLSYEDQIDFHLHAEVDAAEERHCIGEKFFTWYFLNHLLRIANSQDK